MTARDPSAPEPHALHGLKLKAVVDWIELKVTLPRSSQPQHVRTRMPASWGLPWVEAMTDDTSRTAIEFKFRLQDPPGPGRFMGEIQSLALPGEPPIGEADVTITGLEIAIDARHPASDPQALAQAALHLMRHHAHPPAGPADPEGVAPRITGPGWAQAPLSPASALRALLQGLTINTGGQGADYTTRCYVKRHDTQDGETYAPLPPSRHRARFEITLRGSELPFVTIEGWRRFRFEKLAQRFALCSAAPTTAMMALLQNRSLQLGRPDSAGKRTAHRRLRAAGTRRDSQANATIKVALRALTRAQKIGM